MGFLDCFKTEMNQTYSVYPYLNTLDANGNPQQGFSPTATIENKACGFFTGSSAERFVADKYRTDLAGVVISEVAAVPDGAKLVLSTGENFIVIYANDIALQGEVMAVALRRDNA